MVEPLERVDLADIVAQDGTNRCQFLFEAKDFCSTVGFQFTQLFEQALGAFLLGIELGNERVVFDFLLHFAILCGEVGVLVLHFAAVHFSDLPEFSQFFILFAL